MDERTQLEQTIALLESQRITLGDAVVTAALEPLRSRLAALDNAVQPVDPAMPGERKFVTVLFADIAGFTTLSEQMDPEIVRDLVNACFERLVPVVGKYGGTVDKFYGDGVMALFGAPAVHENDPERALRTALGMKAALAEFNAERGTNLALHFGINTGMVVAGGMGTHEHQEYSVMGDVVNVAARLEDLSGRGEVLVGPETFRLTAPLFEFEALTPVALKGKTEKMPVYHLLGIKAVQGRLRGIAGLDSPLVGRETELTALRTAVEAVCQGQGRLVGVIGEAGLGKSRLVAETRAVYSQNMHWVEGRCLSYGSTIAYLPWMDILRALLGIKADASIDFAARQLQAQTVALCGEMGSQVYPYLGRLLSLPLDDAAAERMRAIEGEALRLAIFHAFETLLECFSRQAPLAVVVEDLHWSDPTSLALWEFLASLVERLPILMVAVMRPEPSHGSWQTWQNSTRLYPSHLVAINLDPLSRAASRILVENLLEVEDLPPELRVKILERAEGNPFYVEEIIRSLMDSGVIARDETSGRWYAMRTLAAIDLPDTLQGVLMARIDRLQQETKRILQVAAVIGRSFLYRVLAEITSSEQALDAHLDTLVNEKMIREQARSPELEYIFKHALTQQAAYDSLLKKERRKFHQQVALALEQMFPERNDEWLGLLAYHWEQAGEALRAIPYLEQAGEQALRQFAATEAVGYFSRALELIPADDLKARYRVVRAREQCYESMGETGLQYADVQTQHALAQQLDDAEWMAHAAYRLAVYHWCVGDYLQAVLKAEEAARLAENAHDISQQTRSTLLWSRAMLALYELSSADAILQKALNLARQANDQALEGECLRDIGKLKLFQKDVPQAQAYIEQALALHRALGNRNGEADDLSSLAAVSARRNQIEQAQAYFGQALHIYREIGLLSGQGRVYEDLAKLYNQRYDLEQAIYYSEQALAIWRKARNRSQEAEMVKNLAWIHFHQENYQEARHGFDQALVLMQVHNLPYSQPDWWENTAEVDLAQGKLGEALTSYEKALADISGNSVPLWKCNLVYFVGQTLARLGDLDTGEARLQDALLKARRLNSQVIEMNVLPWLGWLSLRRGQPETALDYCQQAVALIQQVGNQRVEAQATFFLGQALEALGCLDEAASTYQSALQLYLGQHLVKASQEVRAALARLALKRGDLEDARQQVGLIQQHLRNSNLEGTIEPHEIERVCKQVMDA